MPVFYMFCQACQYSVQVSYLTLSFEYLQNRSNANYGELAGGIFRTEGEKYEKDFTAL